MAYVPVPKDLNAVKTKVLLNLTKRQHGGDLHDPAHAALFSAGHV